MTFTTHTTKYGNIDGKKYYSDVNKQDKKLYKQIHKKMEEYGEKIKNEKDIDKSIEYYKKYNKYQKKLLNWLKKHPVKWYNKKDEEYNIIKMKEM